MARVRESVGACLTEGRVPPQARDWLSRALQGLQ
jgi:hypothetical protein